MLCVVLEWLGNNQGTRKVVWKLDTIKKCLSLRENQVLVRMIDLSRIHSQEFIEFIFSSDKFNLLIRVPEHYDLVILCNYNNNNKKKKKKRNILKVHAIIIPFPSPLRRLVLLTRSVQTSFLHWAIEPLLTLTTHERHFSFSTPFPYDPAL